MKKEKDFSKLSRSEQRIAVAKDVLSQIKSRKYIANTGSYIDIDLREGFYELDADIKKNFQKIEKCTVCAMGACLMSITKFKNKLSFNDVGVSIGDLNTSKVRSLFRSLFSPKQLLMIESAFEGFDDSGVTCDRVGTKLFDAELTVKEGDACNEFKRNNVHEKSRLIAIMENIIENKGTFKP